MIYGNNGKIIFFKRIVFTYCFLLLTSYICSGSGKNDTAERYNIFPSSGFHYGFIIRHHKDMAHLANRHFTGYELNFEKQSDGSRLWHQIYGYPQTGLNFYYSGLGHSQYLGKAFAAIPYIKFPLNNNKKLRLSLRFGIGLGWLTKKFDIYENYRNIAISSHLNAAIKINFLAEQHYRNMIFSAGIGLTHFSNGAFKHPNLGINIASLNAGAAYQFRVQSSEFRDKSLKPPAASTGNQRQESWNKKLILLANTGFKEHSVRNDRLFPVYNLCLQYLKKTSEKSEFGGGVDVFCDRSKILDLEGSGTEENKDLKIIDAGIFAAYQLDIEKLKIQFNFGGSFNNIIKSEGFIYHRLALRYDLSERILLNLSLKTHFAKADVVEFGLGYKIN